MNIGQEITDGSVRWTVRDMRSIATTSQDGLMSKADKVKLDSYPNLKNNSSYFLAGDGEWRTLPTASTTVAGIVKIGSNITISNGVISTKAYTANAPLNVDNNGVITLTLPAANTRTTTFLRGDGTWQPISFSGGDSSSSLPSGLFDSLRDLPITPSNLNTSDNALFLTRNGQWQAFYVSLPAPIFVGVFDYTITYDSGYEKYDQYFSITGVTNITESSVTNYYNELKTSSKYKTIIANENLPLRACTSSNQGQYPGVYIVKLTPKEPYIWADGTRTPKYDHWIIRKAINSITLQGSSVIYVSYTDTVMVPYITADGFNQVEITRPFQDTVDVWLTRTEEDLDQHGNTFEFTAHYARQLMPWKEMDGYISCKQPKSGEIEFSALYQPTQMYGGIYAGRWSPVVYYQQFCLTSPSTEYFLPHKKYIMVLMKSQSQQLVLQNTESDHLIEFNNTTTRTVVLTYISDHLPTISHPNFLNVYSLTEYANVALHTLLSGYNIDDGYYPDPDYSENSIIPIVDSISITARNVIGVHTIDSSGNHWTNRNFPIGSIVEVGGECFDHAGTSYESRGIYDSQNRVRHFAILGPDNYWYFIDSEYSIKNQLRLTENLYEQDRNYRRYKDYPTNPNYFKSEKTLVTFKLYDKLILFIQPNNTVSSANGTITINTDRKSLQTSYSVSTSTSQIEVKYRDWESNLWNVIFPSVSINVILNLLSQKSVIGTGEATSDGYTVYRNGTRVGFNDDGENTFTPSSNLNLPYNQRTLEWLNYVSENGQAANYIRIGDILAFTMMGNAELDTTTLNASGETVPKKISNDYTIATQYAIVIGINHSYSGYDGVDGREDASKRTYGIHFMVGTNLDFNTGFEAYNGKKMKKASIGNLGGWLETELRKWLNGTGDYTTKGYYPNLPPRLKRFIKSYKKINTAYYGPNKSLTTPYLPNSTTHLNTGLDPANSSYDIQPNSDQHLSYYYLSQTGTADKIWLLNSAEVFGKGACMFAFDNNNSGQYEYFSIGNFKIAYDRANNLPLRWWLRDYKPNSGDSFGIVTEAGALASAGPTNIYGVIPCFVI